VTDGDDDDDGGGDGGGDGDGDGDGDRAGAGADAGDGAGGPGTGTAATAGAGPGRPNAPASAPAATIALEGLFMTPRRSPGVPRRKLKAASTQCHGAPIPGDSRPRPAKTAQAAPGQLAVSAPAENRR
jgi:hypothetical protein